MWRSWAAGEPCGPIGGAGPHGDAADPAGAGTPPARSAAGSAATPPEGAPEAGTESPGPLTLAGRRARWLAEFPALRDDPLGRLLARGERPAAGEEPEPTAEAVISIPAREAMATLTPASAGWLDELEHAWHIAPGG